MTFAKFIKLYKHYKNNYDFELRKIGYFQIEEEMAKQEEWIQD